MVQRQADSVKRTVIPPTTCENCTYALVRYSDIRKLFIVSHFKKYDSPILTDHWHSNTRPCELALNVLTVERLQENIKYEVENKIIYFIGL